MSERATKAFGKVLKEMRQRLGLSQQELALRSALDRTFVSNLETGKKQPSLASVFALAQALNESPSTLVWQVEQRLGLEADE